MDKFFKVEDAVFKLHQSLRKFCNFKTQTREKKVSEFRIRIKINPERQLYRF